MSESVFWLEIQPAKTVPSFIHGGGSLGIKHVQVQPWQVQLWTVRMVTFHVSLSQWSLQDASLPREDQSNGNVPSAEPCQFGIRPWTAWIFQRVEKTSYKMPSIMRNGRTSLIADLWKSEVRQLVTQISLRCGRRNSMPQRTPMRCKW